MTPAERPRMALRDGFRFCLGEPGRVRLRLLAGEDGLLERRWLDHIRRVADLLQQRAAAGRRRGEHQRRARRKIGHAQTTGGRGAPKRSRSFAMSPSRTSR